MSAEFLSVNRSQAGLVVHSVAAHCCYPKSQIRVDQEFVFLSDPSVSIPFQQPVAIAQFIARQTRQRALLGSTDLEEKEINAWLSFTNSTLIGRPSSMDALSALNQRLASRSFLALPRLSLADLVIFGAVHAHFSQLSDAQRSSLANLARWFDCLQHNVEGVAPLLPGPAASLIFSYKKVEAAPEPRASPTAPSPVFFSLPPSAAPPPPVASAPAALQLAANTNGTTAKPAHLKAESKLAAQSKIKAEKKQESNQQTGSKSAAAESKAGPSDIHLAEFRVGKIVRAAKHPTADRLYILDVDIAEGKPRAVVAALAPEIPLTDVSGLCVLMVNLKPAAIQGVESFGRMLVAVGKDSQGKDLKSIVRPPSDAKLGEKVTFKGVEASPEPAVSSKKLTAIFKDLRTNDAGVAQYRDLAFDTSRGPCKAAVAGGSIA